MFSKAGVGWVYEGFFGVDVPEDVDVQIVLVTHYHERHIAGARWAKKVIINPIEYSMATDLQRALRYSEVVLRRAGAPKDVKPAVVAAPFRGSVYKFTAGWVDLGDLSVRVLPCGSHTWGHTCYGVENAIFVGDLDSWIVSVGVFINVLSSLRGLKGYVVYTGHGGREPVEEFVERISSSFKKLTEKYVECLGEKVPYRIALCARGGGDVLRLSEEGIAFVKYLAENGYAKIVNTFPYTVKPTY
ncbi:MBL fold metallo-hydrolase [Pyrobaculum aerophilum]|uniref:MBL fold metallo-hydrolase n=1 Tax=Pyrobaculum aerophilum TaxID=13773 RepID=UPI0023F282EB|nr:MBL fold metallo-hydrolase [Pyrobaculum aerophilum]MCX8137351.1 MBL fold metallo-hydrolase [Pyrobaculum aerophilum]